MFMVLFIKATVKMCSEAEWGEERNEIKITREREPVNKPGETKGNLLHWKAAGRGSLAGGHRQSPIQSSTLSPFHFPHLKVEGSAVQIWHPLVSESMLVQVCDRRMELKGMPRILISSFPSDSSWDINAAAPQAFIPCPSPLALTVKPRPRPDYWAGTAVSCTGWGIRAQRWPSSCLLPTTNAIAWALNDEVETEVSTDWHGICNMNENRLCCSCYMYIRHTSLYSASLYCGFYEVKVVAALHWAIFPTSFA